MREYAVYNRMSEVEGAEIEVGGSMSFCGKGESVEKLECILEWSRAEQIRAEQSRALYPQQSIVYFGCGIGIGEFYESFGSTVLRYSLKKSHGSSTLQLSFVKNSLSFTNSP